MKRMKQVNGIIWTPFLILICFAVNCWADIEPWENNEWILDKYYSGKIDTLRSIVEYLPENTAACQFLQGIFSEDGEEARFYFDRIVALYSDSPYSSVAMERLWQYHWAKGNAEMAQRYWNFLKARHPEAVDENTKNRFEHSNDLDELLEEKLTAQSLILLDHAQLQGTWTVQVGAFRNRDGAKRRKLEVQKWGKVYFVEKNVNGVELTVVQVGRFRKKKDAIELEQRIRTTDNIHGRVIELK